MRSALAIRSTAPGALLGVTRSITGRSWQPRLADERAAYAMAQAHGIPELLARILAGRGITLEGAPAALSPRLREQLPDPSGLADMDKAAGRLAHAILKGEPVVVFGDYDVDGATSSALLKRFFDAAGGKLSIYIPDRLKEGYGPNTPALMRLADEGARVVITVDCGTLAHVPLAAARRRGLDVIVVDHHQAGESLPDVFALINPNRADCPSGLGMLAAVGLAFLLAVAVNRALREAGWYAARAEPDLMGLLDLVALGTVADVVPLTHLNRVFVTRGLEILAQMRNPGLKALAEVARLDEKPSPYHLGFLLGPRVNAGGRVGEAGLGARLLTSADPIEARQIAARLDQHNQERQAIEQMVLDDALARLEAGEGRLSASGPIVISGAGWHAGVIGIIASRLVQRYGRPAVVIGTEGEQGKGSARSIAGVDLGSAVRRAAETGLLIAGGGHAMAAGLTIARAAIADFAAYLEAALAPAIARQTQAPALALDGLLEGAEAAAEALALSARAAPFGAGFPEPLFALPKAQVSYAQRTAKGHVVLTLEVHGRLRAIAFRAADTPLGRLLLAARERPLHLAGRLKPGWKGAPPELQIEDAALA